MDGRAPRSRGALAALLAGAGLAGAVCLGLGLWQVQRLAWKEALIEQVERQVAAPAGDAPGRADWGALQRATDEYRPVRASGRFDHGRETLVAATTALGSGYWVLTPLRTSAGHWLLVNRGFVPPARRAPDTRAPLHPEAEVVVEGLLRFSEAGGALLRSNAPETDRWYSRDVAAIAAARQLGPEPVAPYFVDARATPGTESAWPRPGLTVLRFSNNHRVYATTWFVLALMAWGALAYVVVDERRLRRPPPAA
ncbi:SURF1 family protein [Ideonella sp.]|uniref:SURF1 family protein n=1 Tax=Ideonella sp. TaxID=1929293 RepID=UPI0035AFAA25